MRRHFTSDKKLYGVTLCNKSHHQDTELLLELSVVIILAARLSSVVMSYSNKMRDGGICGEAKLKNTYNYFNCVWKTRDVFSQCIFTPLALVFHTSVSVMSDVDLFWSQNRYHSSSTIRYELSKTDEYRLRIWPLNIN